MDKIIITLTKDELRTLAHIMDHFMDYMMGDDRANYRVGNIEILQRNGRREKG